MENLQARFDRASSEYAQLKSDMESRVVRWFWASDNLYAIEPFWFECHRLSKGKVLKTKPATTAHHCEYGEDADGRIIVERQYVSDGQRHYETFFFYRGDKIISYRFDYENKNPENVKQYSFECGKLYTVESAFNDQRSCVETFIYQADKLVKKQIIFSAEGMPNQSDLRTIEYDYDKLGQLQSIQEDGYVRYRRSSKKISYYKLASAAQKHLMACLKDTIEKHAPHEPIFSLIITYDDQNMFPPQLGFGTQAERETWGEDRCINLWNAAEYAHQFDLDTSQEADDIFDLFNQEIEMNDRYEDAKMVILKCAMKCINEIKSFALQLTEDFAVGVARFDGFGLESNFRLLYPERNDSPFARPIAGR